MGVRHHIGSVHPYEIVLSDIIGEIGKDKCSLLCLLNRAAVHLDVVALSIHIDLLPLIVNDMSRGHHSTVSHVEVEKSQKIVDVLSGKEIRNLHWQLKPARHCYLSVSSSHRTIKVLDVLYLHVDLEGMRIEVEHN